MKVCEICGDEIATRDGDNMCAACEANERKREKCKAQRRERDEAMRSLGLKKVRGGLGGTYWE